MGLRVGEGRELVVLSTASSSSCAKWAGPKPCFRTGIATEFMSVRIGLPRPPSELMIPGLARKLLDGGQRCLVMLMLPTSLLESLADSNGVGEGGAPEVWPLGGSRSMGGGRGSIFPGPLLVQFAPFLWPPTLLARGAGGRRGHLGKIVQWSLHHGSLVTSYCQAAATTPWACRRMEGALQLELRE